MRVQRREQNPRQTEHHKLPRQIIRYLLNILRHSRSTELITIALDQRNLPPILFLAITFSNTTLTIIMFARRSSFIKQ